MSIDLLEIARRAAAMAEAGEEVEAYVVRTRETDIEVFGGDVESLSVAGVEGCGIRIISDRRQGYAGAGSPGPDGVPGTGGGARARRAAWANPTSGTGWPGRMTSRVTWPISTCGTTRSSRCPPTRRCVSRWRSTKRPAPPTPVCAVSKRRVTATDSSNTPSR